MKKEWQIFINEMILHGDKVKAYKKAYPKAKSENSAAVNAIRLLKNDNILNAIKSGSDKAEKAAYQSVIKKVARKKKIKLLSQIEKREILSEIARGERKIMENSVTKSGEVVTYYRTPNANEIIKAIDTDNKMTGDNAPTQLKHEGGLNIIFEEVVDDDNDDQKAD